MRSYPERELDLAVCAANIRKKIIGTANVRSDAHFGGSLSCVDVLAVLYADYIGPGRSKVSDPNRNRFILSKGHCALALYATLNEFGYLTDEELASFHVDGSAFQTHPVRMPEKGIEISSGSLGLGLSMAGGIALALKQKGSSANVFVLTGNGEANEGVYWESVMFAGAKHLDNLVVILDANGMQNDGASQDVLDVPNWPDRFASFNFKVALADGHDFSSLRSALSTEHSGMPLAVVMSTIKGKGVPFMENVGAWHHGKMTAEQYAQAVAAIGGETHD